MRNARGIRCQIIHNCTDALSILSLHIARIFLVMLLHLYVGVVRERSGALQEAHLCLMGLNIAIYEVSASSKQFCIVKYSTS